MYRKRFKSDAYIALTRSQLVLFLVSALALSAALFFIGFTVGKGYFGGKSAPEMAQIAAPSPPSTPEKKVMPETVAKRPETSLEAPAPAGKVSDEQFTFFESLPEEKIAESPAKAGPADRAAAKADQQASAPKPGETKKELKAPKAAALPHVGFTIQVAAFREKAMADNLSDKLEKKGYRVRVDLPSQEGKETWHKVKVGDFKSEREAEVILKKLKEEEGLKGFIVKK